MEHELRIYVDRNIVRYLPNKLEKNAKYAVTFYIPLDDFDFQKGKKIETILKNMNNSGLDFVILPVPRCLFKSNYPNCVSKKMVDEERKFLADGHDFRFFYEKEIGSAKDRLKIFYRCSGCAFRAKGVCKGIHILDADKARKEKTNQWIFNEILASGQIKLLDLGCGDTLFLQKYVEVSRRNRSQFFCMDPSDISIGTMKRKIPEDSGSSILPLIGIGEHLPLRNNTFDYVLLHYSYSHFLDIEKTMKNVHRILKRGGILLIFEGYHPKEKLSSGELKVSRSSWKDIILDRREFRNHGLNDAADIVKAHGFRILDSFESKDKECVSWGIRTEKV